MKFTHRIQPERKLREYASLLEGVVDLHVHTAPDVLTRAVDDLEYINSLSEVGYVAYLAKNHFVETASRSYILSKFNEKVRVLGGVVLNESVGGLNPSAVDKALSMGAAEVWMPTLDAENHIRTFGAAQLPTTQRVRTLSSYRARSACITVLNTDGELKPEVQEILEMIAEADAILGTGHLSLREVYKVVEGARKAGVKKILVTHPHFKATRFYADDQIKLADMGAVMEHCAVAGYDPKELAEDIRRIGVSRCIVSSDAGQPHKGHPVDVLLKMIEELKGQGISDADIERLVVKNPAKLVENFL
ncbi:MAG: DUF6282 family protein [Thaumarchaeota archaeon]|nr:DUF6282 family protein [Candidatus Calditenuaceae archaeon]MDW8186702.1 DUF6282 family protein [Nitrososphaerota archaeon]